MRLVHPLHHQRLNLAAYEQIVFHKGVCSPISAITLKPPAKEFVNHPHGTVTTALTLKDLDTRTLN